jgi:hypothetical protein
MMGRGGRDEIINKSNDGSVFTGDKLISISFHIRNRILLWRCFSKSILTRPYDPWSKLHREQSNDLRGKTKTGSKPLLFLVEPVQNFILLVGKKFFFKVFPN